ncbi:MAG: hypothetical protein CMM30_08685 [Rhodospirillaceae bacterium]|nr:hypothetical protein [Alphaproteobacteria bacterium]MBR72998.1 hypothetical protein [Rhodospirillaceae bacterium]|tara:strand:+ start:5307 stop:6089 length:783 start_codon:yes stop_codon:yes gene_type:complete
MYGNIINQDVYLEAKSYPFFRPNHPFLFIDGKVRPLMKVTPKILNAHLTDLGCDPFYKLTPVLAFGANASPLRLEKKFLNFSASVVIPVIPAKLKHFDVVFGCHFSNYGSIPATLQSSPNTKVNIAVNYLNDRLLQRMTETEINGGNYVFGELLDVNLWIEGLGFYRNIFGYWSRLGCLSINSNVVALKPIKAVNRNFVEMNEKEVLHKVKELCCFQGSIVQFISKIISEPDYRADINKVLERFLIPTEFSELESKYRIY